MLRRRRDDTAVRVGLPITVSLLASHAWRSDEKRPAAVMPATSRIGPAPNAIIVRHTTAHESELAALLMMVQPGFMAVWTTAARALGTLTIMPMQTISEPIATVESGAVATAATA